MQPRLNAHYLSGGSVNEGCWSCTGLRTVLHFFKIHLKLVPILLPANFVNSRSLFELKDTNPGWNFHLFFNQAFANMLCHPLYFHLCWLVIFFFIDLITFVLHEQPVPQRLNLFFPGSRHLDTSQQNLFVPKPLHNPPPTVEFIGEMNGFLSLSGFSELVCVSPAADISFLFRLCARWFSDQKMHYVSKPVVHGWITLGARGFHESTKVPHRGSSYTHVLYSDNPLQRNWMLGWVECNGEFSGGFFNVCIFAQRPAQPSRAAVWVSGEQAGRFKV